MDLFGCRGHDKDPPVEGWAIVLRERLCTLGCGAVVCCPLIRLGIRWRTPSDSLAWRKRWQWRIRRFAASAR